MAPHWTGLLILALLLLVLFGGRGKISALMGDFAKGITAFRKGLKDDDAKSEDERASSGGAIGSQSDAGEAARREDERAQR